MTEIRLTSEIGVRVVGTFGGDRLIADCAWLTTGKSADDATDEEVRRLLRMLIKDGHGSPFEFSSMVFEIHAPLFVFRQWHRHRIGFSYSEVSGRWHRPGNPPPLEPVFWVPRRDRPMMAAPGHKPTAPVYEPADEDAYNTFLGSYQVGYWFAWANYEVAVKRGIAAEVARVGLPVSVYTCCRVGCNPRSLMAFLAKRVNHPMNSKKTNPQLEIQEAALACEQVLAAGWPLTYEAFNEFGRVAP